MIQYDSSPSDQLESWNKKMYRYDDLFQRNIGLVTPEEQERLRHLRVAVAGVGGVGGITAERLARLGVGCLNITDPEAFEPSNSNRQIYASSVTYGVNKAKVLAEELQRINSGITLNVWADGIAPANVSDFVDADIVVNGIEYNLLEHSVILHRAAREAGKTVLAAQAIGFGATVFAFAPDGMTFEEYIGLPDDVSGDEIRSFIVPAEKFCPRAPSYVSEDVIEKVVSRQMYIPSSSLGVTAAAYLIITLIVGRALGLRDIPIAPDYVALDLLDTSRNM